MVEDKAGREGGGGLSTAEDSRGGEGFDLDGHDGEGLEVVVPKVACRLRSHSADSPERRPHRGISYKQRRGVNHFCAGLFGKPLRPARIAAY